MTLSPAAPSQQIGNIYELASETLRLQQLILDCAEDLDNEDEASRDGAVYELERLLADEEATGRDLRDKADAWCFAIRSIRAQSELRKAEATRLRELAAADEARADRLESKLFEVLSKVDPAATRWDLPYHPLRSRKVVAVEIDPDLVPTSFPEEFQRQVHRFEFNRQAMKKALEAGQELPGAKLVERRSWRIG